MDTWQATCHKKKKPHNAKFSKMPRGGYFSCEKKAPVFGLFGKEIMSYQGKFVSGIKGVNDGKLISYSLAHNSVLFVRYSWNVQRRKTQDRDSTEPGLWKNCSYLRFYHTSIYMAGMLSNIAYLQYK